MPLTPADTAVVFMGSPDFAVPTLRALSAAGYQVTLAVTQPDRPAGRGGRVTKPPVKAAAEELGIAVYQPETLKGDEALARIAGAKPDLIVVAAYGKILSKAVLAAASRGCVNVHASLLPRWRGASPITAAILAGESETGITIMEMAPKMDAGPTIAQRRMAIGAVDSAGTLEARLAQLGAGLLVETLPGWMAGAVRALPQDEALATYCWTLTKADGQLSGTMEATAAERAVRAYNPWPGAHVYYRGKRLAIWKARVEPGPVSEPGVMTTIGREPAIAFSGGWLVLEEVQKAGAKRLSGQEFLNGERGQLAPEAGLRD